MPLLYGIHAQQDSATDAKPHILSFGTARSTANDTLFEIWNAETVSGVKYVVDFNGKMYSAAATAGDLLYAVTGGVSNVRRFDSLAIGAAGELLQVNAGGTAPEWVTTLTGALSFSGAIDFDGGADVDDGRLRVQTTLTSAGSEGGLFQMNGTHTAGANSNSKTLVLLAGSVLASTYTSITAWGTSISPSVFFTGGGTFAAVISLRVSCTFEESTTATYWRGIHIADVGGVTPSITNSYGLYIDTIDSGSTNYAIYTVAGTVTILGSGIVVGAATAGDKGAGTINVAGDIYKNNTVYNDPDAVLEKHFTGEVKLHRNSSFADYPGLMALADVEAYVRVEYQLPRVGWARGAFERTDVLLEKVEETFLYLFDHERRIRELEKAA